ncbi:MAG: hypothetical protein CVU18_03040 [Betaproteobacteria bacterium HGW-Betaproteobacteria-12]|nr:MAG: hypothetical protein CVU18_03040 [Betaproteobacteria bacterium HGW-Betaproteobacteria-12]
MKIDLGSGELCLADNHPLSLREARGLSVRCTAGTIWLTVEGEAGDVFLRAGQSYRLASNGLALLESIGGGGRLRLERPPRLAGLWRRLARLTGTWCPVRLGLS